MTTTPNLELTLLETNQSQKEVTVNEALIAIDAAFGGAGGASPYDVGVSVSGKAEDGEIVMRFIVPRAFTLPAGLVDSQANAGTAATAQADFDVRRNGVSFGSVSFAAASAAGTFAAAAEQAFAAGDVLSVVAPATADATLADISIAFAGLRQ